MGNQLLAGAVFWLTGRLISVGNGPVGESAALHCQLYAKVVDKDKDVGLISKIPSPSLVAQMLRLKEKILHY